MCCHCSTWITGHGQLCITATEAMWTGPGSKDAGKERWRALHHQRSVSTLIRFSLHTNSTPVVPTLLHTTHTHLEKRQSFVRLVFVDFVMCIQHRSASPDNTEMTPDGFQPTANHLHPLIPFRQVSEGWSEQTSDHPSQFLQQPPPGSVSLLLFSLYNN